MTDITDEDRRAAASILWVQTVIDDQAGIERAFAAHRLAAEARGAERERARVKPWSEEEGLRQLALLYNHKDDDSPQFTRWQMLVAMHHGRAARHGEQGEG